MGIYAPAVCMRLFPAGVCKSALRYIIMIMEGVWVERLTTTPKRLHARLGTPLDLSPWQSLVSSTIIIAELCKTEATV